MTTLSSLYILWNKTAQTSSWTAINSSLDIMQVSIDDIREKAEDGQAIWLVLPAKFCSVYQIKLPKLPQKDVPQALMSILEDKVLQDFSHLWWFYQKAPSGLYQVVLCDKAWMDDVREFWKSKQVSLKGITLDWFALKPQEIFVLDDGDALMRSTTENGCFSYEWLLERLQNHIEHFQIHDTQKLHQPFEAWMVQRFLEQETVNMDKNPAQFDFSDYLNRTKMLNYFPKILMGALGLLVLVFVIIFSKNSWMYFQNLKAFKEFSPQSYAQLETNLLRYRRQEAQKKQFWSIWIGLQKAYPSQIRIRQLKFEQNQMQLTFEMKSVATLQQFKSRLMRERIKILQSKVQTMPNGVKVVLTLRGRA